MVAPVERECEFDCIECGRHIIRFASPKGYPKLCALCLTMPGWFNIPEVREIFDPEFDLSELPQHERRET